MQDAAQHPAVINPRLAAKLRQQWFDRSPFRASLSDQMESSDRIKML
jgi:hypothetical protein